MPVIICSKCGTKNRVEATKAEKYQPKCGRCGTPLDLIKAAAEFDTSSPLIVSDSTFERDVLKAGERPVLVDCWAPWCGPCQIVAPVLDQLAAESRGKYTIAKLNVDENPRTSADFQIQSIPTMLIFRNGHLVDRLIGAQPKQAIAARLANAA